MGTKTLITAEQYAALDEPAGLRYELSKGELIVTPSPMMFHNRIRDEIGFRLRELVRLRKLGEVTIETDFQLSEDTVRRPDVAFISCRQGRLFDPHKRFQIAPDLAVEIASPSDRPDDLMRKVQQYPSAGTATLLMIYPEAHLAYLHRGGKVEVFERGPMEILPGFKLDLAEILG